MFCVRGVALGADERQTDFELAQLALRCELEQSVDRRPVLLEGMGAQQARNGKTHVGHPRHEVLVDGHSLRDPPGGHSRERDQIRDHRIQRIQAIGALRLVETLANPSDHPEEPADVPAPVARPGRESDSLQDRIALDEPSIGRHDE